MAAGLATVVCLAAYAWLEWTVHHRPARPHAAAPASVTHDDLLAEGFSYGWPEFLVAATSMYHCAPTAGRGTKDSVVVWTDKANQIVAFGPAQEGETLPAHVLALGAAQAVPADTSIRVAEGGHAVLVSARQNTLQVNGMQLACVRTWDD